MVCPESGAIFCPVCITFPLFLLAILFSHAEVLENIVESFLGGDLSAGDFGEDVKGLAEVFGK